jgi:hypothetical protein
VDRAPSRRTNDLIDCEMGGEEYAETLRGLGVVKARV